MARRLAYNGLIGTVGLITRLDSLSPYGPDSPWVGASLPARNRNDESDLSSLQNDVRYPNQFRTVPVIDDFAAVAREEGHGCLHEREMQTELHGQKMNDPDEPIMGEPATPDEIFFAEWGEQTLKQSAPALQDSLQKLITLDAALIGGVLIALKEDVLPPIFRLSVIVCFLVSLGAAMCGVQPLWRNVTMGCAEEIKAYQFDTIRRKSFWIRAAYACLIIGFALAIYGILVK